MSKFGDSASCRKDAEPITTGNNINTPEKSEEEVVGASYDHDKGDTSVGELSILVYKAHINRVLRTAARASTEMRKVPDITTTTTERAVGVVSKSGSLSSKFRILDSEVWGGGGVRRYHPHCDEGRK